MAKHEPNIAIVSPARTINVACGGLEHAMQEWRSGRRIKVTFDIARLGAVKLAAVIGVSFAHLPELFKNLIIQLSGHLASSAPSAQVTLSD